MSRFLKLAEHLKGAGVETRRRSSGLTDAFTPPVSLSSFT